MSLLRLLADGGFHSGVELAGLLEVSRTTISNKVAILVEGGLQIDSVTGKGYRLVSPVSLLDKAKIELECEGFKTRAVDRICVDETVSSTNDQASRLLSEGLKRVVCLAEIQESGRGRRGRHWLSVPGMNFCGSVGWTYEGGIAALEGLSLAIGVAVAEALSSQGIEGVLLKWPNDIVSAKGKVGGILIEMQGEVNGPCQVVVGVGLNIYLPENIKTSIDQTATDLYALKGSMPNRHGITVAVLREILATLERFPDSGFGAWKESWLRLDALAGKNVQISGLQQPVQGVERGVNDKGAILLESNGQLLAFYGGEVSLRPMESSR